MSNATLPRSRRLVAWAAMVHDHLARRWVAEADLIGHVASIPHLGVAEATGAGCSAAIFHHADLRACWAAAESLHAAGAFSGDPADWYDADRMLLAGAIANALEAGEGDCEWHGGALHGWDGDGRIYRFGPGDFRAMLGGHDRFQWCPGTLLALLNQWPSPVGVAAAVGRVADLHRRWRDAIAHSDRCRDLLAGEGVAA